VGDGSKSRLKIKRWKTERRRKELYPSSHKQKER
jgi:hypothetical protein